MRLGGCGGTLLCLDHRLLGRFTEPPCHRRVGGGITLVGQGLPLSLRLLRLSEHHQLLRFTFNKYE